MLPACKPCSLPWNGGGVRGGGGGGEGDGGEGDGGEGDIKVVPPSLPHHHLCATDTQYGQK